MVGIGAPSIRLKALRLPPSSRIATFSVTPSSLAFATAAFTIFCASSKEMLCFFTTLAIGHLPLDIYFALIMPRSRNRNGLFCRAESHCRDSHRDFVCVGSSIHSAIDGKVRAGNVRGLGTCDKRHHRGDLIHTTVTVERCGGLLGHRPITRGGIQFGVDRTRLHVVDRDAPTPDLSGQRLSKHLDGSLSARVWHKPGCRDTLTYGRTDRDDATAALHVLQRCLRGDEYTADVDVE